jgi:hypothetical protein
MTSDISSGLTETIQGMAGLVRGYLTRKDEWQSL